MRALLVTLNFINHVKAKKDNPKEISKLETNALPVFLFFMTKVSYFYNLRRHANNSQFVWHYKRRK